jgi:hypothetical protein
MGEEMRIGIVGLSYSGKSTLFEAITGSHGTAMEQSGSTRLATVTVPDERLDKIAATINPAKITHAHIDFVDVAGVSSDMDNQQAAAILSGIREADGLVHVVRWFESPNAPPHPHGTLSPKRDLDEMMAELIVADLDIVERRIEKLEKQVTKTLPTQDRDRKELALMQRMKESLEEGRGIASLGLSPEDSALLRAFQFLSEKPMLNALNVGESRIGGDAARRAAEELGTDTAVISAQVEKEITELDPADRDEFLKSLAIGEPASSRIIRACYNALGLLSFFTAGDKDCRAWTLHAGENALTAAGRIHTDIARGFIRAEVTAYEDFEKYGTVKEAHKAGRMRLEGKDYIVRDGDIINIRFKV